MSLSDLVDGYNFWIVFSALPPMIWFYPLNELDLTGYEAFVVVLFSPILLWPKLFTSMFTSSLGYFFIRLIIAVSLLSFQATDTFWRLCLVAVGASFAALKMAIDLSRGCHNDKAAGDVHQRDKLWGYTAGFVALLVSRVAYKTITPAFNDHATNWSVFAICLGDVLYQAFKLSKDRTTTVVPMPTKRPPLKCKPGSGNHCFTQAAAFGSLLYIKLAIFGEISVPFRWLVQPYPNTGPCPNPWAVVILLCMIVGYWLGYSMPSAIEHPVWSVIGCLAFVGLYKLDAWQGFFAACVLAVYVCSTWTVAAHSLAECCEKPAVPLTLVMIFYLIPAFYSVWTVAYNFVPLGVYTREFTGLAIGWLIFFIFLDTVLKWRSGMSTTHEKTYQIGTNHIWQVIILLLIACGAMYCRYSTWRPLSFKQMDLANRKVDHVTAMIWTYHFGYDNDGWPSLDRTAKLIRDIDADVVGLLETDASRLYMGNNDLAQWLAETLNMYVDYGPATKKHTWGSLLLSKYPIVYSQHYLLPSPKGELAPAISAVLKVGVNNLSVIVTHMGNDRDDVDRKLQTEYLSDVASKFVNANFPLVFLGYVTSHPFQRDYNVFVKRGRLKDIDESDKSRFCEYIFYQNLIRLSYARISKGRLSDTEVQVAKFAFKSSVGERDSDVIVYGSDKDFGGGREIPKNRYFSPVFGDFFRGHYPGNEHRFHMSTPKYFLPAIRSAQ